MNSFPFFRVCIIVINIYWRKCQKKVGKTFQFERGNLSLLMGVQRRSLQLPSRSGKLSFHIRDTFLPYQGYFPSLSGILPFHIRDTFLPYQGYFPSNQGYFPSISGILPSISGILSFHINSISEILFFHIREFTTRIPKLAWNTEKNSHIINDKKYDF